MIAAIGDAPIAAGPIAGTPARLRINQLSLCDFRAFPGPLPQTMDFQAKNVLIYGENGTGKSSIFHALREFFSFTPSQPLAGHKNVFSGGADADCRVEVQFSDGQPPAIWKMAEHPGRPVLRGGDIRVRETALRRACLDYRALLDTNYIHGENEINLFSVAVRELVRDFTFTPSGGQPTTIGEIWDQTTRAFGAHYHRTRIKERIRRDCVTFNQGFVSGLQGVDGKLAPLLADLNQSDLNVEKFSFAGLTYREARLSRERKIDGQRLGVEIKFRNYVPKRPQNFLNEARLSALGLAMYLASRLACTPTSPSGGVNLLVLDDVLIGLDQSNRLPLLDLLAVHFSDWQTILLTYDRVWFEMAKFYLDDRPDWTSVEIYEETDPNGHSRPYVRPKNIDPIKSNIATARQFLADHHIPAAAVHARIAFELALKKLCDRKVIPTPFHIEAKRLTLEELLNGVEQWLDKPKHVNEKTAVSPAIQNVRMFGRVVLNPFSHSTPVNLARAEVEGAIGAVEKLHDDFKAHIK